MQYWNRIALVLVLCIGSAALLRAQDEQPTPERSILNESAIQLPKYYGLHGVNEDGTTVEISWIRQLDPVDLSSKAEFIWHSHADTDEVFLVLHGVMRIDFRDGSVEIKSGEMFSVPRGGVVINPLDQRDQIRSPRIRQAQLLEMSL